MGDYPALDKDRISRLISYLRQGSVAGLILVCSAYGMAWAGFSFGKMTQRGHTATYNVSSGNREQVENPTEFSPTALQRASVNPRADVFRSSGGFVNKSISSLVVDFEITAIPPSLPLQSFTSRGISTTWATFHPARSRAVAIDPESQNESGSPSEYERTTGRFGTSFNRAMNFSVSSSLGRPSFSLTSTSFNSASACLAFDSAISSLCRLTTAQVASPAISPNPPTASSEPLIISSKVWSDKPQIIRTLFDDIIVAIVLFFAFGLLTLSALFFWRAWRSFRC
jgi:hypothetical protein